MDPYDESLFRIADSLPSLEEMEEEEQRAWDEVDVQMDLLRNN